MELYVDFDEIRGLEGGARVYHQGVEVGEVHDIRTLEDGTVRATLHIHPKYQNQLKSNSDLFITDDSLIPGQKCIYLYPRDESRPPQENGTVVQGVSSWEVYLRRGKKALEEIPDLAKSIAEELKEATPELRQEILPALLKAKDAISPLMEHIQEGAPEMLKDFREILEIAAHDFQEAWQSFLSSFRRWRSDWKISSFGLSRTWKRGCLRRMKQRKNEELVASDGCMVGKFDGGDFHHRRLLLATLTLFVGIWAMTPKYQHHSSAGFL